MNWSRGQAINPELLAAYFDGEFEGRDDTAALRRQVENWLEQYPEARDQLADYRRLRQLWQETVPPEPRAGQWDGVLAGIHRAMGQPQSQPGVAWRWSWALGAGAAACVALVWLAWPNTEQSPSDLAPQPRAQAHVSAEDLLFPVARADEIVILAVDGDDTGTLVVGEPPVKGPLEMATRDEVRVTSMQPDLRDNMVPRVRGNHPMIWAVLASERAED